MEWNYLKSESALEEIKKESFNQSVVIFKHSTRCSISSMVLDRLQRAWNQQEVGNVKPYYLDLVANRPVSNKVSEAFDVTHESPQLLLINQGNCVYHTSHMGISFQELKKQLDNG